MNVHRAKKLPVLIEATDVIAPENIAEIAAWCGAVLNAADLTLTVTTMEGPAYTIGVGNRIIRGVRGEHYPIAEEIFRATYKVIPPPPPLTERGWQRDAANRRWTRVIEEGGADGPITIDVTDEQLQDFERSQRANGQDLLRGVRGSERLERCVTWLATRALAASGGQATTAAPAAAEITGAQQ